MNNLRKKTKLVALLKKMGDSSFPEGVVLEELVKQFENVKGSIPSPYDDRTLQEEIKDIHSKNDSFGQTISILSDRINNSVEKVQTQFTKLYTSLENNTDSLKEITGDIENIQDAVDTLRLLINSKGGGNASRDITLAGVQPSRNYRDIDFIAGTGITIAASDDMTNKRVKLTFAATSTGSSLQELPAETPNGLIVSFTFTHTPNTILRNGIEQLLNIDYTVAGNVVTLIDAPLTSEKIWNSYGGAAVTGSTNTVASYDLSSQCDGSNTVFTVPANTNFLALMGSDAPNIYQITSDFTGSGTTTLTLTAAVRAPSSGARLTLLYVP